MLVPDPYADGGVLAFAVRLRNGEATCESVTRAFLERIEALNPRLGAFEFIASESAIATARAIDALLAAGTDLGPLMGVPVVIKDLIAVEGMPTTNGSNLDTATLSGKEGTIVKALRRAGCVILGKGKTVEFALGATGINHSRGTPWNPWDANVQRIPGGSSSGPAVAVAAGLCGFAIGSDTGGSVRLPACFCGIFGHKTSSGLWPIDGVFPLSPTFDTLGPLTRSARDAALVQAAVIGLPELEPRSLCGIRLGRPRGHFFDHLDPEVASCFDAAIIALQNAGAKTVDIDMPEATERSWIFPAILPADVVATLGVERFLAERGRMDPVVAARASTGLETKGVDVLRALRRYQELVKLTEDRFEEVDAWITPTTPIVARPVDSFADVEKGLGLTALVNRNTQPGNMFGMCAVSLPIHQFGSALPVGLQLMMPGGNDAKLLAIACAAEKVVGKAPSPDLAAFAR